MVFLLSKTLNEATWNVRVSITLELFRKMLSNW